MKDLSAPQNMQTPPNTVRVLWVSHAFGYGDDLMYFGEIFRALRDRLPANAVVVDHEKQRRTPYRNPYDIDLRPILRQVRIPIRRRGENGVVYKTETTAPSPSLVAKLAAAPVDVLIAIEFTPPALMAAMAARLFGRKGLVLMIESDPAARGGSRNPVMLRLKRMAVGCADVIQTNNEKGRRYATNELGASPEKVRVAPYLTSRPPGPDPDLRRRVGPVRMLFANTITPRKGLRECLDAMARLAPEELANVDLTVIGDGEDRAELEERANSLGLGSRLCFLGRKAYSELGAYYAQSDVLLIPSLSDYRSLAGFEGLAYGLALLASVKDGATEETVVDGQNGFAIDPTDPDGFADRMSRLVKNPDLLWSMRRASLARYATMYSLEEVAKNISESVALAAARHKCGREL